MRNAGQGGRRVRPTELLAKLTDADQAAEDKRWGWPVIGERDLVYLQVLEQGRPEAGVLMHPNDLQRVPRVNVGEGGPLLRRRRLVDRPARKV